MRNHRNDSRENHRAIGSRGAPADRNPEDPQDVRMEDLRIQREEGHDERYPPQRNPRDNRSVNIQHVAPIRRNSPTRRSQSADFWEARREREGDPI